MKKIFIPTLALIALISSCKVHSHSSRIVDVSNDDIQTLNYTATVSPDFSKRVQGISNKRHKTESKAKKEAYYNAIVENSIHVLIDPIYSVSTTKKFLFIFGQMVGQVEKKNSTRYTLPAYSSLEISSPS